MSAIDGFSAPVIVTGAAFTDLALGDARELGVEPDITVVEPVGRNTAPAIAAAALVADLEDVLVILPSDQLILDQARFESMVGQAVEAARSGAIVAFGITPTRVETGYGYIEMGKESWPGHEIVQFHEKPDPASAATFAKSGAHVWNSGMFVGTARTLLEEIERHEPDLLVKVRSALTEPLDGLMRLNDSFEEVPAISFDHAVMERTERGIVMPGDIGWTDVGSFEALWDVSESDQKGNVVSGDVELADVSNSLIRSTTKPVAVLGVSDVVVIETEEGVLVVAKDRAQDVKNLQLDFD